MSERALQRIRREIEAHEQNAVMAAQGYRPVYTAGSRARLLIIGQAPGIRAQLSEVPWNDRSGEQLRRWLALTPEAFYDRDRVALVPMDFYFPGRGKSGDLPPRSGFAARWHPEILAQMPQVELTLLIGQYAQRYYLPRAAKTLTETVRAYRTHLSDALFPLPHPSPRNNIWKKRNPWFEAEVVPELQFCVRAILQREG